MIEEPEHKGHERAVGMVLGRVHPVETTHRVEVDHRHRHRHQFVTTEKVLERINTLAAAFGMDAQKMPAMIDLTPERQSDEDKADAGT
jgi:hypothetical protein